MGLFSFFLVTTPDHDTPGVILVFLVETLGSSWVGLLVEPVDLLTIDLSFGVDTVGLFYSVTIWGCCWFVNCFVLVEELGSHC